MSILKTKEGAKCADVFQPCETAKFSPQHRSSSAPVSGCSDPLLEIYNAGNVRTVWDIVDFFTPFPGAHGPGCEQLLVSERLLVATVCLSRRCGPPANNNYSVQNRY